MNKELYIGLMSGTSMDAVDCALVQLDGHNPEVLALHNSPFPQHLRQSLLGLSHNQHVDLRQLGETDIAVGQLFADTALQLLDANGLVPRDIRAIGSHGQTIWHQPPGPGVLQAFSLQIGDPNTIAERTGITTVADFRRRDMAAGGQGAPIVPALHRALFQDNRIDRIVLNLGGIANITLLPAASTTVLGMDTGPASLLMDAWIQAQRLLPFDADGAWAASAQASKELLALLLEEPYFSLPAPKSTGRELFNLSWLERKLAQLGTALDAACVQATLLALTVETVARAIEQLLARGEIIVCGGGAHNLSLMQALATRLPDFKLSTSTEHGLHVDYVEAVAFAWFASKTLKGESCGFEAFTGARREVVAGGIYQA
jgi:anhydro-N-acetylmuramic acid kinase